MNFALLDINDAQLQLWHGEQHAISPGYALLNGSDYLFGQLARNQARLRPRDIHTRYWSQLGTEPLQPALGPARHSADLVHAHLKALHLQHSAAREWLFAIPGSMQREQLALLLGIVQQCPFDAVGLVHRAVALGSMHSAAEQSFHLELQLHQALLSELHNDGERVRLVASHPLPGCGLLQLQEKLVEIIAASFIRQTRFDPRRKADSEQQLYDALPKALRDIQQLQHCDVEVQGYCVRLNAAELSPASEVLINSVRRHLKDSPLCLADTLLAELPGIDALPGFATLPEHALQAAVSAQREELIQNAQALNFITELPAQVSPPNQHTTTAAITATEITPVHIPSHLLTGAIAKPLHHEQALEHGWQIIHSEQGWQLHGDSSTAPAVNGEPASPGQVLQVGDRLRLPDGSQALLIEVAE